MYNRYLMIYYTLPKNNANFQINTVCKTASRPHIISISHSVHYYNNILQTQMENLLLQQTSNTVSAMQHFNQVALHVNPHEFLFTAVPSHRASIGKIEDGAPETYELIEVVNLCNLLDSTHCGKTCSMLHIGALPHSLPLSTVIKEFALCNHFIEPSVSDLARALAFTENLDSEDSEEEVEDTFGPDLLNTQPPVRRNSFKDPNNIKFPSKFEVLFFNFHFQKTTVEIFFQELLYCVYILLRIQSENGACVIKIDGLHCKIMIDILFILNSLYNKVCIIKPSCSSPLSSTRYLVCKQYAPKPFIHDLLASLHNIICSVPSQYVSSLLDEQIPLHFINKLEEIDVIIGQQQMEAFCQIINVLKHKNKEDKLELYKRNNLIKCVQWCEKYHIPHNKLQEKGNSFTQKQTKNSFMQKSADEEVSVGHM